MEKLKHFDRLTISRCNSKSSLSDPIPSDVLMDIISRLPAKYVGKCRCVSKFWALILGRPEFEVLFLTRSLLRPQFLFAFIGDAGFPFCTSPQIQNPNHDTSSSLVLTPHHTYLPAVGFSQISRPVRGWVCIEVRRGIFGVCNPITGKTIILPNLKKERMLVKIVLGYDPIDKQFKVLFTTWSPCQPLDKPAEHYVLTLGAEQLVWRTIECCKPLLPIRVCGVGICINGVLYYMAERNHYEDIVIVCFDIRFEKLSFINTPEDLWVIGTQSRLINHNGQLGIMMSSNCWKIDGRTTSFALWVLKDIQIHEWTKHIYELPLLWWDVVAETELCIVGMIGTCEIVLSPRYQSDLSYLFYYNLERCIVRRVGIQGFEGFNNSSLIPRCFLDYEENLKLM